MTTTQVLCFDIWMCLLKSDQQLSVLDGEEKRATGYGRRTECCRVQLQTDESMDGLSKVLLVWERPRVTKTNLTL